MITKKQETVSKETVLAIVAIALLGFSGILSETSMNVTFPTLMKVFNLDLNTLQWITTGYLLTVAIMMTTSAALKKNFSERQIFFTSSLLFTLGTITAVLSNSFIIMIVGRVLQGIGTGIIMPQMFNIILERVPYNKIGTYMGIAGLIMSLAPAFGPTYGGFMIAHFSWHWIFICILPVPIIASVIAFFFLKNSPKSQKITFDFLAFFFLAISLSSLLLAITSLENGTGSLLYLIIFAISFLLFLVKNLRSPQPFLDIRVLKVPSLIFGLLPFFVFQFANLGSNFIIPNYLVLEKIATSSVAGMVLLPGTLIGSFTAPLLGRLFDEKGAKLSLYLGNSLFAAALLLFTIFTKNIGVLTIPFIYIIFTIGRNMAFNNTMAVAIKELPKEKTADATAIFQMSQQFAGALGTAIASILANSTKELVTGVHYVFLLQLFLVLLNFVMYKKMFKFLDRSALQSNN